MSGYCTTGNSMNYKRWLMPILVGFLLFGNHYTRDSVGALEKQMESELNMSGQDYSNLNALFFFPNIITPLLAGMVTERLGGVYICFLYSTIIASIGHLVFAFGIQFSSLGLIYLGRALTGSVYEIIDAMMPISYLGPLFTKDFQIVVGFMQIFIRMGSVVNFIVSPYLYLTYNIKVAFWVATAIGMASVPLLMWTRCIELEYVSYMQQKTKGEDSTGDIELLSQLESQPQSHIAHATAAESHEDGSGGCGGGGAGERSLSVAFSPLEGLEFDDDDDDNDDDDDVMQTINFLSNNVVGEESSSSSNNNSNTNNNVIDVHNPLGSSSNSRVRSRSLSRSRGLSDANHSISGCVEQTLQPVVTTTKQSYRQLFLSLLPLDKFTFQFYLYLISGSFLYGSIVPFWFIGSRYMQDRLYLDVATADGLVALPEFMVIIVGFPLGLLVNTYQFSLRVKLVAVCISMCGMVAAYGTLVASAYSHSNGVRDVTVPTVAVTLLGFCFAVACSLIWGAINELCVPETLAAASGILSCGVNVLPAIIPPILSCFEPADGRSSNINMIVLAVLAGVGALFGLFAAYPECMLCCGGGVRTDGKWSIGSTTSGSAFDHTENKGEYSKVVVVDDDRAGL